jgi:hypothetical protein
MAVVSHQRPPPVQPNLLDVLQGRGGRDKLEVVAEQAHNQQELTLSRLCCEAYYRVEDGHPVPPSVDVAIQETLDGRAS